jgi:hypothetical protein
MTKVGESDTQYLSSCDNVVDILNSRFPFLIISGFDGALGAKKLLVKEIVSG